MAQGCACDPKLPLQEEIIKQSGLSQEGLGSSSESAAGLLRTVGYQTWEGQTRLLPYLHALPLLCPPPPSMLFSIVCSMRPLFSQEVTLLESQSSIAPTTLAQELTTLTRPSQETMTISFLMAFPPQT